LEMGFHSQAATFRNWFHGNIRLDTWRPKPLENLHMQQGSEIRACTTPSQWRHCPGENNPADHLLRGITPDRLKSLDERWHGPSWIMAPEPSHFKQHAGRRKTLADPASPLCGNSFFIDRCYQIQFLLEVDTHDRLDLSFQTIIIPSRDFEANWLRWN
jgi:hypothetical protein